MTSTLKLAFAGTPVLAADILRQLLAAEYCVTRVYTQPDKPAGRGRKIHKSEVKALAESANIVLRQPLNPAEIDAEHYLADVDLLIVAAYGMILPAQILQRPRLGCINIHTSLLPRWRGAAPIQRAIQAGDNESGITIMQMDSGLDTGDILLQKACPIHSNETAGSLHDRLALLGAEALLEVLEKIAGRTVQRQKQNNDEACYAPKITKAEAEIDWHKPAEVIARTVRAFNPFPVAHTTLNGLKMRLWEVEVRSSDSHLQAPGSVIASSAAGIDVQSADRIVRIHKLQLPGKKISSAAEFHNGHLDFAVRRSL